MWGGGRTSQKVMKIGKKKFEKYHIPDSGDGTALAEQAPEETVKATVAGIWI